MFVIARGPGQAPCDFKNEFIELDFDLPLSHQRLTRHPALGHLALRYQRVKFIEIDPYSPQLEQAPQGRYPIVMDPDNPIVKLCVQGMECESSGRLAEALRFFMSAWMQSRDDFERCVAAHYVARHQKEPVDALLWNQRSLDHANAIPDDRVREFYPSLYLNMGKAHEDLGNREDAKRFYQTAEKTLDSLPKSRYGTIVREAVERALLRTGN